MFVELLREDIFRMFVHISIQCSKLNYMRGNFGIFFFSEMPVKFKKLVIFSRTSSGERKELVFNQYNLKNKIPKNNLKTR